MGSFLPDGGGGRGSSGRVGRSTAGGLGTIGDPLQCLVGEGEAADEDVLVRDGDDEEEDVDGESRR